jgi:sodium-coupled neutral amino acid transporter 11
MDGSLPLHENGTSGNDEVDLEEMAAKRIAGGGMIDSVANMANSILGAGNVLLMLNSVFAHALFLGIIGDVICLSLTHGKHSHSTRI